MKPGIYIDEWNDIAIRYPDEKWSLWSYGDNPRYLNKCWNWDDHAKEEQWELIEEF